MTVLITGRTCRRRRRYRPCLEGLVDRLLRSVGLDP